MMLAHVFPGQGSQKRGMGQGLFDEVGEFVRLEKDIDAVLGYSLRALCLEDTQNRLRDTRYTQPALYVVNALHHYKEVGAGARPTHLAGHSLGEYNALHAAGAFDLLTGLRLVRKRGELMAQATNGGMMAVIGLSATRIRQAMEGGGLHSLDVANFNSPSQTVISGPVADIGRAGPILEKAGAGMCIPLQVSAAFHSRYMAAAAREFAAFLASVPFAAPRLPVISNVTARPYPHENPAREVADLLVRQITEPVQWTQSVRHLVASGVGSFKEMGPGNVLTRLIQQIQQEKDS